MVYFKRLSYFSWSFIKKLSSIVFSKNYSLYIGIITCTQYQKSLNNGKQYRNTFILVGDFVIICSQITPLFDSLDAGLINETSTFKLPTLSYTCESDDTRPGSNVFKSKIKIFFYKFVYRLPWRFHRWPLSVEPEVGHWVHTWFSVHRRNPSMLTLSSVARIVNSWK